MALVWKYLNYSCSIDRITFNFPFYKWLSKVSLLGTEKLLAISCDASSNTGHPHMGPWLMYWHEVLRTYIVTPGSFWWLQFLGWDFELDSWQNKLHVSVNCVKVRLQCDFGNVVTSYSFLLCLLEKPTYVTTFYLGLLDSHFPTKRVSFQL